MVSKEVSKFWCCDNSDAYASNGSICPQVEKVSLHPDKQPKPKAPPAKQVPAKKELASGGSKEVRHTLIVYQE